MPVRPRTVALLLPFVLCVLKHAESFGIVTVVDGFAVTAGPPAVRCDGTRGRRATGVLNLGLGDYSIELEKPLGMILEERTEGGDSGVRVKEILKDESAGSAWKSGRVAPCEVLLRIDGTDVSRSGFDCVMDILTAPSDKPTTTLVLGDGLGQFDMPKNVLQRLESTEDAFFVDAVVREAVRAIRRDGRLGDLLSVEIVIGAGVTTTEDGDTRGMVRFFGIFSTDGVTTYSCNVSATGLRSTGAIRNEDDPNNDIRIVSLSCAKDEGLGRTYDLIQEDQDKAAQ